MSKGRAWDSLSGFGRSVTLDDRLRVSDPFRYERALGQVRTGVALLVSSLLS